MFYYDLCATLRTEVVAGPGRGVPACGRNSSADKCANCARAMFCLPLAGADCPCTIGGPSGRNASASFEAGARARGRGQAECECLTRGNTAGRMRMSHARAYACTRTHTQSAAASPRAQGGWGLPAVPRRVRLVVPLRLRGVHCAGVPLPPRRRRCVVLPRLLGAPLALTHVLRRACLPLSCTVCLLHTPSLFTYSASHSLSLLPSGP